VIIQNVLWLECKTHAPLVNGIVKSALYHSSPCTHKSDAASNHSYTALPLGRVVDFYSVGLRPGRFGGHISGISYRGDHDALHCTFGVEAAIDAQTVWDNIPCEKDHQRKNLFKTDTVIPQRI